MTDAILLLALLVGLELVLGVDNVLTPNRWGILSWTIRP
jgi:hypothetical protein